MISGLEGIFGKTLFESGVLILGAERQYRILYAAMAAEAGRNVLIIASSELEAKKITESLEETIPGRAFYYPREPLRFTRADSYSTQAGVLRARALAAGPGKAVAASVWTACEHRLSPRARSISGSRGDRLAMGELIGFLAQNGYERSDTARAAGQFAVRGGIVDICQASDPQAVRVEYLGDEIESIRRFDPETQRSTGQEDSFTVRAFSDVIFDDDERRAAIGAFRADADERIRREEDPARRAAISASFEDLFAFMEADKTSDHLLLPYHTGEKSSLLDALDDPFVLFWEPSALPAAWETINRSVMREFALLLEEGAAAPRQKNTGMDFTEMIRLAGGFDYAGVGILDAGAFPLAFRRGFYAHASDLLDYRRSPQAFMNWLAGELAQDRKAIFYCPDQALRTSVERLLEGYGVSPADPAVAYEDGTLETGTLIGSAGVILIAAQRVISQGPAPRARKMPSRGAEFFTDITPGDYVVHEVYGIGVYEGMERVELEGTGKDYFRISYAKGDVLYVGAEQLDLLSKYVGTGDAPPKVSRMGTGEWSAAKTKARGAVKELAQEYISMYAQRAFNTGYAFGPDGPWQDAFEEAFEHVPTPDQLRCSEEIKEDMQRPVPMDRLLLGDVGFGKTEVAMRAAFKAVMEGKQVALLAPTTILALQHWNSFLRRFSGYPVKISMLSRLTGAAQQRRVLLDVKAGVCDILIGTHRMISSDVAFSDLGLLIVDEEQRFGVAAKDRLKLLKKDVDVLTLSATPIPRTLHMSLSQVRDLSVIDTPPANRLPVQTFVAPYESALVREAVENELARGGQVFYVHNRVSTIEECASSLSALVPSARVRFAHGQMSASSLEAVVAAFLEGEFDVLVATSIIENGVDFQRANTLIVENSDFLGLSQLYQMRGRVGRSDVQAYAYFTYRPDKTLSEDASKRLKAIREFTKFGSGFNIAMRDLQIRGAGNILGARQHGHFAAVGYEMYSRMLAEAIAGEESAPAPDRSSVEINIAADAFIPDSYIASEEERIAVYKKIAYVETEEERGDVYSELADRFGQPPAPVVNLLAVAWVRTLAKAAGASWIRQSGETVQILFPAGTPSRQGSAFDRKYRPKFTPTQDGVKCSATCPSGTQPVVFCAKFLSDYLS